MRYTFQPVQRDGRISPHPLITELASWCTIFDREGLTPEEGGASTGNLSFRTTAGFVITPTRARYKSGLQTDSFVEVVRVELLDREHVRVHYLGGLAGGDVPSSDTLMHHLIYAHRTDVTAVFHGHDDLVLAHQDALGVPVTGRATAYGSLEDAEETIEGLGTSPYLIRREHGFVSVGRTMAHAGQLALDVHQRAVALATKG